ncbi:MAG: chloride channel protein [Acidimicrobiales bacterium]
MAMAADPMEQLKSRSYVGLLILAALMGVPVAAVAYFFLKLIAFLQTLIYVHLPVDVGFKGEPLWWPLPVLVIAGVLVSCAIQFLPGTGGHEPADGFKFGGGPAGPAELPGIALAALGTLALGVVLGPEAPLIAIGGGLGVIAVRLAKRDAPPTATVVIASAGSFAAISTLLGSPLIGAFLLLEASGLGGPILGLVLVPGLLSAGIGYLIFVGLNSWTGYGTFSLVIPHLPAFATPDVAEFGWALVIGVAAAVLGVGIRQGAIYLRDRARGRILVATPIAGAVVALVAIAFEGLTGRGSSTVLFSGQSALPTLVTHASTWTAGALVLLVVAKSLAYGTSLSSFRGGPIFPSLFIGAAGGIALTHVAGLPLVPAVGMGIGAMSTAMLRLPFTSVLLASLFVASSGMAAVPLIIVAATVTYVLSARLTPAAPLAAAATPAAAAPPPAAPPATPAATPAPT